MGATPAQKRHPAKYKQLWKTPGQAVSECCLYFGSDDHPCGAILDQQDAPGPPIPPRVLHFALQGAEEGGPGLPLGF